MRVTSLGVHERSVDQVCTWASFKRRLLASMNVLTTAPNRHACAHYGAQQARMCSPRRPTSCASEAHPRTMGIGAMLGAMRLAVWRLPQTTEAVCSTTVIYGRFPPQRSHTARRAGGRTVYCKNHSSAVYQLEASAL